MKRELIVMLLAAALVSAAEGGERKQTLMIGGQRCCIKHRTPRISVRGFEAKPLVLVHSADPRSVPCEERAPNHIWDSQRLRRTHLHPVRGIVTYCAECESEYWQCLEGDYQLTKANLEQIRELVSRRSDIRKPILRIVADGVDRAVMDAGAQKRAGDLFDDLAVGKRHGKWKVISPIVTHLVVATGR